MVSPVSEHADWPRLTGRQEPHFLSEWPGDDSDGVKAVELGRRVGKKSMPWQASGIRAWMRRRPDGLWTHRNCVMIISRQNGKTLLVILRILIGLFVLNDRKGERIVYSAQRWQTAEDVYKRTWSIIKARPWLLKRVVSHTCSGGRGYIETAQGARVAFVTRSGDLGKGFDEVDLVIYDEAYNLSDVDRGALSPTQLASQNPQTIYLSTSVDEETMPNCDVLAGMRRRGLDREEDLDFREWMAPEDMPLDEVATWEYANPSFGVIHQARDIREELKSAKSQRARRLFGVEYLGRGHWPKADTEGEIVIDPEVWAELANQAPRLTGSIAVAVDRPAGQKWWAVAAAQRTTENRVHVEIGYFQAATNGEAVAYLGAVVSAWDPCVLVIDKKSDASVLAPLLIGAGIEPELTNAPEMVSACKGFYDDAVDGVLEHTDQPVLRDAVAVAVKRTLPGGDWAWDGSADTAIAPLVAATLARWGLVTFGATAKGRRAMPAVEQFEQIHDEFDAMAAGF